VTRIRASSGVLAGIVAVLVAGGLLVAGCRGSADDAPRPFTVKVGSVLSVAHPTVRALSFLEKRLEELSGGRFDVVIFPASQLGGQDQMLDGCRTGDVQMTQISAAVVSEYVPLANALSMPFIFRDSDHQVRVLEGEPGRRIAEQAREVGLEILGYLDSGTRNITTRRGPIEKPEDLRGMKIRVMDSKVMVRTINALGASAVAMNQGEVFTALQQGVLDGWENNPQTVVDQRMYETGCIYFAWTRHFAIPDVLMASKVFLDRLTPEERGWVEQAVRETIEMQRGMWQAETIKALEIMRENGMKINDVDLAPFQARVDPIYREYYAKFGDEFRELCETIRNMP